MRGGVNSSILQENGQGRRHEKSDCVRLGASIRINSAVAREMGPPGHLPPSRRKYRVLWPTSSSAPSRKISWWFQPLFPAQRIFVSGGREYAVIVARVKPSALLSLAKRVAPSPESPPLHTGDNTTGPHRRTLQTTKRQTPVAYGLWILLPAFASSDMKIPLRAGPTLSMLRPSSPIRRLQTSSLACHAQIWILQDAPFFPTVSSARFHLRPQKWQATSGKDAESSE
ncbi:uncharacterized protein C8Q71DRAFT_234537 [Rhodofomes roseus]|uniref:Uncharacterized protein n=1 Tax=Rhodofomes roseus TaxID=34475 RepID=A0ABQ8KXI7_9APHY|nr:uncharacterized protein C8Q71DRAFT_234537 [Rhodofomes roseus]KAH9843083.1 hypothetical protein C8Q71DRAFT_234537 [Rhodofomes roseus]